MTPMRNFRMSTSRLNKARMRTLRSFRPTSNRWSQFRSPTSTNQRLKRSFQTCWTGTPMTQYGTVMGPTFQRSTADFGAEMVAWTALGATVVPRTTFHGGADSVAEEFLLADWRTGKGECALAATTFGGYEEVTGRTVVEVAGRCTGVTAGKEFGAWFGADGDGIFASSSFDEVCYKGLSTRTEFDVFRWARTRYYLGILRVTSFLTGMDSTIKFPVVRMILKTWSTCHKCLRTDKIRTTTLTLHHFVSHLFLEMFCRNNEPLSNGFHSNMILFPWLDMVDRVLGDTSSHIYGAELFHLTMQLQKHYKAEDSNMVVHKTSLVNRDRNQHIWPIEYPSHKNMSPAADEPDNKVDTVLKLDHAINVFIPGWHGNAHAHPDFLFLRQGWVQLCGVANLSTSGFSTFPHQHRYSFGTVSLGDWQPGHLHTIPSPSEWEAHFLIHERWKTVQQTLHDQTGFHRWIYK